MFFFEPKTIRNIFLKKKTLYEGNDIPIPSYSKILITGFFIYFLLQIGLPLRHHFIKDNVLWTEEGHRLSWRMMLRTRSGNINFRVVDKETNQIIPLSLNDYVTPKQKRSLRTKPDFIWQFSQRIKEKFASEGKSVSVFVTCYVSINGKRSKQLINPEVDMATADWNYFWHNDWILPSK